VAGRGFGIPVHFVDSSMHVPPQGSTHVVGRIGLQHTCRFSVQRSHTLPAAATY
jgi:hypothetical protein